MSMKLRWLVFGDLVDRYRQAFRAAWAVRRELDTPQREAHELDFLPAHLELTESPVHPAPRWAMRLIVIFAILVFLWAVFGRVEVVAVASGKLIPNFKVKQIQSIDSGIVRKILVTDGQRVKAGDVLIELDTKLTQAESDKMRAARLDSALAAARAQALLSAQQSNTQPRIAAIDGLASDRKLEAERFVEGQIIEHRAKVAAAESELAQRQAALETTRREVDKLTQTVPLARQSADNYRALMEKNYVSRQEYLEKEQARIEREQDLAAQVSHAQEMVASVEGKRRDIESMRAQFRREQLDALNQAQQLLSQHTQDEAKARERHARMKLVAPVDGTVQQLTVHTLGGVVEPARSLMVIVPEDTLEAEAGIENKDIGFVNVGQEAVVKIESFPYTRFGYLTGTVVRVANDAAQDKRRDLVFPARVRLASNRIQVERKWVNLTPGMAVTVEIKTGTRSVIGYFLSPLVEYGSESLRER